MYGDAHNHGKSVACVCLNETLELIYKPRSLENELHFQKLLKRISSECALWDERMGIKIISRPDYGWEEKICFQECASEEEVKTVEQAASDVGKAFQIRDDILDVTSTLETLGKPIHSDDRNEKTTYVTLKGLEQASEDVEEISRRALARMVSLPYKNEFLTELIRSLIYREK